MSTKRASGHTYYIMHRPQRWLFSQFIIGHYFNDWLRESGMLIPGMILSLMPISMLTAWGKDAVIQAGLDSAVDLAAASRVQPDAEP